MEVALRDTASRRLLFVLNHSAEPRTVALPAGKHYIDLLGNGEAAGQLELAGYDVRILVQRSTRPFRS